MIIRQESHWRELNSRPTPYQGVAIPLSHSGVNLTNRDLGLIATELKKKIKQTTWIEERRFAMNDSCGSVKNKTGLGASAAEIA